MITKDARKIYRKQTKAIKIMQKDFNIKEREEATCYILVCNAGLVTGTTREELLDLFSPFGVVEKLMMIPNKSYSFLVFSTEAQAKSASESINGNLAIQNNNSLFVAYLTQVPDLPDPSLVSPPPGLEIIDPFISAEEEEVLLDYFNGCFAHMSECSELKNRKVKHFGFEFEYGQNDIDADKPISEPLPPVCLPLLERMVAQGWIPELADQLTANLYLPGQGIPPHTDTHSCCTDWLCSVSLGSGVLMEFRDPQGLISPVWLPSRSLLLLKDEARYCWKHGIAPRSSDIVPAGLIKSLHSSSVDPREDLPAAGGLTLVKRGTRISLTFRKTTKDECRCRFPAFCNRTSLEETKDNLESKAATVESKMVHQVYEEIASHFSETRHKPWPRVLEFIKTLPEGGVLVDLGCGNGKYLGQRPGLLEIGADFSHNLLKIVAQRGFQGVRCDMLNPALRDGIASGIICIAALHHLSTAARRVEAIQEMRRMLEPGGRLLIYVWAQDQQVEQEMSSYLKQNKKNFKHTEAPEQKAEVGEFGLPVHQNRTNFTHQDILVPWKLKPAGSGEVRTFKRYYHVFKEGELEELLEEAGGLLVHSSYYDQGNWCAIAQKI